MECPVCCSTAVVARTCVNDLPQKVQEGIDPYDLICSDSAEAECRNCGHIFVPGREE